VVKSISSSDSRKPRFPLWHHKGSGRWCKKRGGKFLYFQKVADDPSGTTSLEEWSDFQNGRAPKQGTNKKGLPLRDLVNEWLTTKESLVASDELALLTFKAYHTLGGFLLETLGKHTPVQDIGPTDFLGLRGRMARKWGPTKLKAQMGIVSSIFKFGRDNALLAEPVLFGSGWKRPSKKVIRKHRASKGPRIFEPADLRKVLDCAETNLRAMILLGANAALGPADIGLLPTKAVDLDFGWLGYARNKTGIMRRIPLWPETVKAIRQVIAERPTPKDREDGSLLFITAKGLAYIANGQTHRISLPMRNALRKAGIEGRTFYDLRRGFQTVSEGARDLVATQAIMGHCADSDDMGSVYRQRISDERLLAVTDHVRHWLFGETKTE